MVAGWVFVAFGVCFDMAKAGVTLAGGSGSTKAPSVIEALLMGLCEDLPQIII